MQLCIDMGNTRVKLAVFDQRTLLWTDRMSDPDMNLINEVVKKYKITHCILSTTRNIEGDKFKIDGVSAIMLSHETPLPIKNKYSTPTTLGKDRLAAAVAVSYLHPNEHCVFIDCGTCLTYNFVYAGHTYYGGNIAPGVSMRLKAMHHYTDKLPLLDIKYHEELIGQDTAMAIQNGALKGAIYEITSFIQSVKDQYGDHAVVLTGGDANILANHLNFKIFAHPNLVLIGLNEILMYNADLLH